MTLKNYFKITRYIWTEFQESRKGNRGWGEVMSLTKRDELLDELRKTIPVKDQSFDDKELFRKIEESRARSLENDISEAFKPIIPSKSSKKTM